MAKERYLEDRKVLFKQLNGRILDIGCNWGEIHNYLDKKQGKIAYGMDIILTNYRDNVVRADAHYIPFKDETFDSIFAGEIIEHLEDPAQFLREVERVLKRGGHLILTTPNIHSLSYIKGILLRKETLSDFSEHIYGWDLKLLRNFFQKLNLRLEIEECGYVDGGGLRFYIKLIRRLRPDFGWFVYVVARKI